MAAINQLNQVRGDGRFLRPAALSLYRHSGQGEPKMVVLGDPERSVLWYVSTGSAQNHHLQAAMG